MNKQDPNDPTILLDGPAPTPRFAPVKRTITPHKGGRTICKSTNVTERTDKLLQHLRKYNISLGDLIEWATEDQAGNSKRAMEIEREWNQHHDLLSTANRI